jgi:hypothetical protein
MRLVLLVLLAVQAGLGAWLSIVEVYSPALPVHALVAIALAALIGAYGLMQRNRLLFALALLAPVAGFTVLHYEHSPLAAFAHAAAAAALLATAAYSLARA